MSVNEKMTAIANGFRSSRGLTGKLNLDDMALLAAEPLGSVPVGNKTLFQTVDVVVDNTSVRTISIPIDDVSLDNYIVDYTCIETGVYTDGVLTLDETPTFPTNMNLPMFGTQAKLKEQQKFNGYLGTTIQSDKHYDGSGAVARASLSSYAYANNLEFGDNELYVAAQYSFGKVGYYFKFRCVVYGWNNPEVA